VFIWTSAVAGEGKTVTACNLAMTLSQSYRRRVLLIDADLRHPKLHHLFNVPNSAGLSDGLLADRGPALSVHVISDTLSLLTAGPRTADPMSLLISDRMRRVLAEAASRYDWVILDTPPALLLPDANLLAGMVDTSVLVVGAETTPYRQVRRAVEVLGRERILGLVLNRAHDHALVDSYGYPASYPASTGVRI
jgi:capsular exopolysaccharide synthesis family protein